MMKLKKQVVLGVCCLIMFIMLLVILLNYPSPPLTAIDSSLKAMSKARHALADIYAPQAYEEVERQWQKTLATWHQENQKFFITRDFKNIQELAEKTSLLAQQVEKLATHARDSLKQVAQINLALLQMKLDEFKVKYQQIPIKESVRIKYVQGELLVLEGNAAFQRLDYKQAVAKLKRAESFIGESGNEVTKMLTEYLKNIPLWQKWTNETIDWSRENNELAIVIDKIDHVCRIYHTGNLMKKYPIELGPNWIGHKRQKGDNATPEGQYFIVKKIHNGRSKYYKALVIDYPNKNDQEVFAAAKKRGELIPTAQIGGLIEIHGAGGKGINWTQGCIALKNEDIDEIFDLVKIGTPVTIVGTINNNSHPAN